MVAGGHQRGPRGGDGAVPEPSGRAGGPAGGGEGPLQEAGGAPHARPRGLCARRHPPPAAGVTVRLCDCATV
eukprot:7936504-Pyramimonas_sp.AAC.1